jgi:wyosine [tRNA(Phe)-imidazoG37] synthetase (radical SAM superfamily)
MTTRGYIKHVDFKGVFGAEYAKMSRHWREVLSEDIRSSLKGTSGTSPGKITAAERQKIWKAVCTPYDKLNWDHIIEDVWDGDEEDGECTMTVTKLKRHFRDVMKKEGEKVAGAR